MADERKLSKQERFGSIPIVQSGEKARHRASAKREIEELSQNDEMIRLMRHQNQMLWFLCQESAQRTGRPLPDLR